MKIILSSLFAVISVFSVSLVSMATTNNSASSHDKVELILFGRSSLAKTNASSYFKKDEFVVEFYIKKTTFPDSQVSYSGLVKYGYLAKDLKRAQLRKPVALFDKNKIYGESELVRGNNNWADFRIAQDEIVSVSIIGKFNNDSHEYYSDKNTTKPFIGFLNYSGVSVPDLSAYPVFILLKEESKLADKEVFHYQVN